ncbi:MAG: 50S ribosomal protein L25 [Planctomycetota bacterium]|jgi:large subunit ribosomal protein L25
MEKNLLLKAEIRERAGTKDAVRIRKKGRIPAVIYGHKEEPLSVTLDAHDFTEDLHHGSRIMDIQIGRKKATMMVKELQYDHLGRDIIHADLMRVDATETVKVTVPIELKGTAKGTHEGGIIEEHVDHIEIECRVTDMPENIAVSVKDIGVGDNIHAGEIELPEGIKLVSSPEILIVTCSLVAAAKTTEELELEVPTAPEVIGEEKEEEETSEESS